MTSEYQLSKITKPCYTCGEPRTGTVSNLNKSDHCLKCYGKISFEELLEIVGNSIKLLTTREDWLKSKMLKSVKIIIKCTNNYCDKPRSVIIQELKSIIPICKSCLSEKRKKKTSYVDVVKKLNDVVVLTTEEEWNLTSMSISREYIKIKCINNTCTESRVLLINGINSKSKACEKCCRAKSSSIMKIYNNDDNGNASELFTKYELEMTEVLEKILEKYFIVETTIDGCKCDMYIKPIDILTNQWLQIQLKSSNSNTRYYCFGMNKNKYENMIVIFYHITDHKFWLADGNVLPNINVISIGKNKSPYDKYAISSDNIASVLLNYYKTYKLFNKADILKQLGKSNLVEHANRVRREELIGDKLTIKYPKQQNTIVDVYINDYSVQDKSGSLKMSSKTKTAYFSYCIRRSKSKTYCIGDCSFYWFYNKYNPYFLVIPEELLLKYNHISSKRNEKANASFSIDFNDCKNHKFADYMFDYNKLDIEKLTKMFEIKKI